MPLPWLLHAASQPRIGPRGRLSWANWTTSFAHLGLLREHAAVLALVLVLSTLAGLATTALVLQALWRPVAGEEAGE
jgi:hypothetical protein